MTNRIFSITFMLFLSVLVLVPSQVAGQEIRYVPGEVLVKFRDGTPARDKVNLHAVLKAEKKKDFKKLQLHHVKLQSKMNVEEAIREYRRNPAVEYAEPNYILYAHETTPNDPLFDNLWGLDERRDHDIDAPEAWDITTGDSGVVIAVIDSGLAYNHPDFDDNVWTNDTELAQGENNIDDDGNGYVDDFYGYDFVDNDGYPLDYNQHGTHVSGTIAAQGHNATGITGVMWDARIMPVRFLGLSGSGSTSDAIAAINYACANNVKVINNSWGGGAFSTPLKDAIENCASGALFIFSAGNSSRDNDTSPMYPASYDSANIVSVAASDSSDDLASFSSYGATSVDLAAPGVNIYSSIPQYSYGAPEVVYAEQTFDAAWPSAECPDAMCGWVTGGTNNTWAVTAGTGVGGTKSLEDSPGTDYSNDTFSWAVYDGSIDSSVKGKRFTLTFDWKGELELNYDWLDIIYSGDGINWDWIDYRTGSQSSFTTYTADYTAVGETFDKIYFGFRIDSDISIVRDGVYIDNVKMEKQDISISAYSYEYYNGTSMSAPHVSGVAGLLLSYDPTLTWTQLKNIILNTVDPVASLAGKVLTGGRLNAHSALLAITPPDAPSGLSAIAVSSSQVNLSWTDNAANETGFKIERKTGVGGSYSQIATRSADATSYADTGRTASTTYYYRVRAYNTNGDSAYSNEANDTTLSDTVPDGPSGLSATAVSSSQINLSWTDNADDETGFKIERKTGAGGTYSQVATRNANSTSYSDTGLAASTTYYYRVRAYNTNGDSAYSNEASATTPRTATAAPTGGGGCFIATAAYGSYLAPEVEALKRFRDNHLLTNRPGREFVAFYYRHSPPLADIIRKSEFLRTGTRIILTPVVLAVAYPYGFMLALTLLFGTFFSLASFRRNK